MKRIISVILVIMILFTAFPTVLVDKSKALEYNNAKYGTARAVFGYNGKYVVAFNPGTSKGAEKTELPLFEYGEEVDADKPTRVHVKVNNPVDMEALESHNGLITNASYSVGDKRNFKLVQPLTATYKTIRFKCMAVGSHCYVWTPESGSHILTTAEANSIKGEFENNYSKMINAFGDFVDVDGTHKVNLVYYDIEDGYNGGTFIGGFFTSVDMYSSNNNCAMINLDTYPSIQEFGLTSGFYSIIFHEFQHLINFSNTGLNDGRPMDSWLNEMMSAAAEDIIYPNSCVNDRLPLWSDSRFTNYHNGKSIYDFDNSLGAYVMSCLLEQYLSIHCGTTIFKKIITSAAVSGKSDFAAVEEAVKGTVFEGMTTQDILNAFRIASIACNNDGIFGFKGNFNNYLRLSSSDSAVIKSNPAQYSVGGGGAIVYKADGYNTKYPSNRGNCVYTAIDSVGRVLSDPTSISSKPVTVTSGEQNGTQIDLNSLFTINPQSQVQNLLRFTVNGSEVKSNIIDTSGVQEYQRYVVTATTVTGLTATTTVEFINPGFIYIAFFDYDETYLGCIYKQGGGIFDSSKFPTPKGRNGYYFVGWSPNVVDTPVNNSVEVHAVYDTVQRYKITYYVDGKVYDSQTYPKGAKITPLQYPAEKVGYTFSGWQGLPDTMPDRDINVYGEFKLKVYTVTFKDWNGAVLKTQSVEHGKSATAPADPVREGYIFFGWDKSFTNVTSDLVITAQYTTQILIGDANGDGVVNTGDAVFVLKYAANMISFSTQQLKAADYDKNGVVNTGDAVAILKYCSK